MLSQLSYGPSHLCIALGLGGLEPPTPRLSSVCSDQLSYRPFESDLCARPPRPAAFQPQAPLFSSKEVIQPQVPLRLPCYDFVPVMDHTVASATPWLAPRVKLPASGTIHSHDVTGGVYKARERIHRGMADPRLLAIPTSWSRVAGSNPDYEALFGIGSPSRVGGPLYAPL